MRSATVGRQAVGNTLIGFFIAMKIEMKLPNLKNYLRLVLVLLNFLVAVIWDGSPRFDNYYLRGYVSAEWKIIDFSKVLSVAFLSSVLLLIAYNCVTIKGRYILLRIIVFLICICIYCHLWHMMSIVIVN